MLGNPASILTAYPCREAPCDNSKLGHVAYNGQIPPFQFVSSEPANGPIKITANPCNGDPGTSLGGMSCTLVSGAGMDDKYIYTFSGGTVADENFELQITIGTNPFYTERWANSSCYPCDTCFYKLSASHSCNFTCAPFKELGNVNEFYFAGCNAPPSAPNVFEDSKTDGFGKPYMLSQRITPIYNIEFIGWGSALSSIAHFQAFDQVYLTDMKTGRECKIQIQSASSGEACFGTGLMSYSMGTSENNSCCDNKVDFSSC